MLIRTEYLLLLTFTITLFTPAQAVAVTIRTLEITHSKGSYHVTFDVLLAAEPEKAWVLLSDYQQWPRLSHNLKEAQLLERFPDGRQRVRLRFRSCVLIFCKTIRQVHGAQVQSLEESVQSLRREGGRLYRQATIDALTGVGTRQHIVAVLQERLQISQPNARPLSLILVDVDFFKQINDHYGHTVGDSALRGIAARIKAAVRDTDAVGRYGGDEFVAVLPDTSLTIACEVAERMREHVASTPIHCEGRRLNVSISLGLAQAAAKESVNNLIARADGALYRAKKQGCNRAIVEQEGRYRSARSTTSALRARLQPQIEPAVSEELSAARAAKKQRPLF